MCFRICPIGNRTKKHTQAVNKHLSQFALLLRISGVLCLITGVLQNLNDEYLYCVSFHFADKMTREYEFKVYVRHCCDI